MVVEEVDFVLGFVGFAFDGGVLWSCVYHFFEVYSLFFEFGGEKMKELVMILPMVIFFRSLWCCIVMLYESVVLLFETDPMNQ